MLENETIKSRAATGVQVVGGIQSHLEQEEQWHEYQNRTYPAYVKISIEHDTIYLFISTSKTANP